MTHGRAASSQLAHRSVCSRTQETKPRPKGPGLPGVDRARLWLPICRVPALDSARAERSRRNRPSPAKRRSVVRGKSRRSDVDPTVEGEGHCCPRSECRSVGCHCSAWHPRDARDTEGSVFGREHQRVRSRMTGQCPKTRQRLVDAVTVDQSTDRHFDTGGDVRVASQRCFPEREAGAGALASRAQETPRKHHGLPRRRKGIDKRRKTHR